jgi:hypothetical protein
VEHSVPQSELVRPWRTATLVATAIAGVELILLIVAGIVLLGKSLAPHVKAAAQQRASTAKAAAHKPAPAAKPHRPRHVVATLPRARTKVVVLNGNGVQGAAAEAASLIQARGYRVKDVTNAPHTGYAKTLVMYRPGFAEEAKRFARDLNFGLVEPLDGMKPRQLHGAQIVLILGAAR